MSPKPVLGPEIQDSQGPSGSFHTNRRTSMNIYTRSFQIVESTIKEINRTIE